jgi:hypothetical protein
VCELVRTDVNMTVHRAADGSPDLWAGRASVTMDSASEMDPLHDLAPTRMIAGFYGTFDWTLPQGRSVKDYVAEARGGVTPEKVVRRIRTTKGVKKAS